jgi:hypothetical protein
MRWTPPAFEVLKMDAEIGSYQEDTGPIATAEGARPSADLSKHRSSLVESTGRRS